LDDSALIRPYCSSGRGPSRQEGRPRSPAVAPRYEDAQARDDLLCPRLYAPPLLAFEIYNSGSTPYAQTTK